MLTTESMLMKQKVTLTVTFKGTKSFGDPECVHFFNVIFNKVMRVLKYVKMKQNFYDKDRVSPC